MAQGQFEAAIPVYRSLVRSMPADMGLLQNLAMAEALSGHAKDAIPHLETVLRQNKQSIPALTMLGMARLQRNEPEKAVEPLTTLVALRPEDANARGMLADAQMGIGKYGSAATNYRLVAQAGNADAKAWYGLGKANEALARERFEELNRAAPESAYVATLVGDSRLQRGQLRSAFFFYREAQKKMPDLPGAHRGLAAVYERSGHADWAAIEKQSIKEAKQTEVAGKVAALYEQVVESSAQAEAAFAKLGELPESPERHAFQAQIDHDRGQDLEAAKEWQAAETLSGPQERTHFEAERATALFLGHDYPHALPLIETRLKADPQSPDWNFMMGESLWRSQQPERAVPYLERSLQQKPNMLPAHAALGLALVALSRNSEAASHLERAASLDDDGSLHYSLARAYQAAGNREAAKRCMQQYQDIQQRNAAVNGQLAKEAEITAPAPAR